MLLLIILAFFLLGVITYFSCQTMIDNSADYLVRIDELTDQMVYFIMSYVN